MKPIIEKLLWIGTILILIGAATAIVYVAAKNDPCKDHDHADDHADGSHHCH